MALNFPDSPQIDDLFSVGTQTWKWTGVTWDSVYADASIINLDGGSPSSNYGGITAINAGGV